MHAAPVPVERTGLRLRIARASDPIELEDDTVEHDGFVRYRYRGYVVPLHAHLVQVGFHEGSRFHLIPDGRGKTEIASDPLLSPSGRRFATAVSNLPVNYDPNGIQVWDMKGSVPVLRLGVGGEEWGASAVMWVDENTLEFTRDSLDATLRPVPRRMRLVLDAAGFRMEPVR